MKKTIQEDDFFEVVKDLTEITKLLETNNKEYKAILEFDARITKTLCSVLSKRNNCSDLVSALSLSVAIKTKDPKNWSTSEESIRDVINEAEKLIQKNQKAISADDKNNTNTNQDTLNTILKDFDLLELSEKDKKIIN